MSLWHDFAWELGASEDTGMSSEAQYLMSQNVSIRRKYPSGLSSRIVFSSRIPLASAVSAARNYILRHYDALSRCVDSTEYEIRGYFEMEFTE